MTHFRPVLYSPAGALAGVMSCGGGVLGEIMAARPAFRESHRGPGGCDGGGLRGGADIESRSGGGIEGPRVWRDPETSRRRFRLLSLWDVSGPEEALSRRLELCRRWLRPERRSKERMLELLVLEHILSLLPRRLRHRFPESEEEAAAWACALHPASP